MKSTKQITIGCKANHLWEVLTQPSFSKQYMYSCEVSSSWNVGDPVVWNGEMEGKKIFLKGVLLDCQPHKVIKFTTFDPDVGMDDVEENYIHVTYTIHAINDECQLTITNETFDGSSERMSQINKGWDYVIGKIAEVAEK